MVFGLQAWLEKKKKETILTKRKQMRCSDECAIFFSWRSPLCFDNHLLSKQSQTAHCFALYCILNYVTFLIKLVSMTHAFGR